ncbi:hypothetical protein EPTV-WA-139 [Eptesipox virus]|uniref:Uncharacterized protein n=1 Tax=Eptesipox virus TaxID=1329402 RepID=A0A220T6J8_9POXV|nr:hypothetical protein CG743_gp139 [Eptesipox virus]ASK51340.1 hypothetical protein EPTV-WA-139 [Eptesipox virus]
MIISSSNLYYCFCHLEKQHSGFINYFLHLSKLCKRCSKIKCCICLKNNKNYNILCVIRHVLTCFITDDEAFYILNKYIINLLPTSLTNIIYIYFLRVIQHYIWDKRTTLLIPINVNKLTFLWNKGLIFHNIIGMLLPNYITKKQLFITLQNNKTKCYICEVNNYYSKYKNINIFCDYEQYLSSPKSFMQKIKHLFCLHCVTKTFLCSELQDTFMYKNIIKKNTLYSLKDLCSITVSNYIKNIINQLYYFT